ncbi:unnamed protein product [Paramecium sonneborni]|uniref:Uncharacterized protein n=1 Tax=Paramecium sonneborni TaxID=65129 RepID=A0A8S1NB78_9CILI|nr:unnamed protein product [Paramecium sonneborni]
MKIANFISRLQKSIYQFSQINAKLAIVVFTNGQRDENFKQRFPGAKQIFQFDEQQKEREVKIIEDQREIIKFNDSSYLGSYVNKIFKNPKQTATRFHFAQVEFLNKDYWYHLYEIIGTMDIEQSMIEIRIKQDVLKECLEFQLENLEQYRGLFVQKIVNIGIISQFQISLKSYQTENDQTEVFTLNCLNSKEDSFYWGLRKLLYKSDGKIYEQVAQRAMNKKPQEIVGEVYPQLE